MPFTTPIENIKQILNEYDKAKGFFTRDNPATVALRDLSKERESSQYTYADILNRLHFSYPDKIDLQYLTLFKLIYIIFEKYLPELFRLEPYNDKDIKNLPPNVILKEIEFRKSARKNITSNIHRIVRHCEIIKDHYNYFNNSTIIETYRYIYLDEYQNYFIDLVFLLDKNNLVSENNFSKLFAFIHDLSMMTAMYSIVRFFKFMDEINCFNQDTLNTIISTEIRNSLKIVLGNISFVYQYFNGRKSITAEVIIHMLSAIGIAGARPVEFAQAIKDGEFRYKRDEIKSVVLTREPASLSLYDQSDALLYIISLQPENLLYNLLYPNNFLHLNEQKTIVSYIPVNAKDSANQIKVSPYNNVSIFNKYVEDKRISHYVYDIPTIEMATLALCLLRSRADRVRIPSEVLLLIFPFLQGNRRNPPLENLLPGLNGRTAESYSWRKSSSPG